MGRTIVIANQKGGVGKTTTAINLSASLADLGKKILVIDTDPQGNTSSGLGVEKNEVENTVYELLIGESKIEECIQKEVIENLDIISSNINLAAAEIELTGFEEKEFILKKAVDQVRENYDFIIIDCPPSLNTLTINAMCAADTVLVPIQCEYYALEGLSQLMNTVELVRDRPQIESGDRGCSVHHVRCKNQSVSSGCGKCKGKSGSEDLQDHYPKKRASGRGTQLWNAYHKI